MARCQVDQQIAVIVGRCFVPAQLPAFPASVRNDKTTLRVRFRERRVHHSAAPGRAVAGIDVQMQGTQAFRTVVARCILQRRHLMSAVCTDKSAVIFCKPFCVHFLFSPKKVFSFISISNRILLPFMCNNPPCIISIFFCIINVSSTDSRGKLF